MSAKKRHHRNSRGPSARGPIIFGSVVLALTGAGFAALATVAEISGAVIAPGVVSSESRSKKVQHPDGGIIALINVDDGAEVNEGEVLIRLDDVQMKAQLGIVRKQLGQLAARGTRLRAEVEGAKMPNFEEATDQDELEAISIERAQFVTRREALTRSKGILDQQVSAKQQEITSLQAEIKAIRDQARIARAQSDSVKSVYEANHAKVLQLEREMAEVEGRDGQRNAELARAREQVGEIKLRLLQLDTEFQQGVLKDLAATEERERELFEKRTATEDKMSRIDIRASESGTVHEMTVTTIGGVIRPSETLMSLVPKNDKLIIEARASPADIDQLSVGQPAVVRFVNFNRRTTPELLGKVVMVSADVALDQSSQRASPTVSLAPRMGDMPYYAVKLELNAGELRKLDGAKLVPGMQVQTFITTGERTVMSYLTKPILDRFQHAMRER